MLSQKNGMFCHINGGDVAKQHYHMAGFGHTRIDGVTVCICHITGCGVAKRVRFGNEVGVGLRIKYYSKKII